MVSEKGLKNLANMLSANLILQSVKRLDDSFEHISEVGKYFDVVEDIALEHLMKSISYTAGDKRSNEQLVKYINLYIDAKFKKYPYKSLKFKRRRQILKAYNIANHGHHNNWESLIQESIIKAIGKNALFDQAQVVPKDVIKLLSNLQSTGSDMG